MPNLVGLRDTPPPPVMEDQGKHDTLMAMQMEALGLKRRDFLSTTEFKENKIGYVSIKELEPQRLVNNSTIGEGEKFKLEGWNNAWTQLHDDGTDSQNLQDVNEGLGQTHRAKLMQDSSVRDYIGESNFRGGGHGDRGGRGGNNTRRDREGKGKAKGERKVTFQGISRQPVTRVRVPKGHRPTTQPDVPRRHPSPTSMTVSAVKSVKGSVNTSSVRAASIRQPIMLAAPSAFMASINARREQPRDHSSIKVAHPPINTSKKEAAGHNIGTSISKINSTISFSDEKAMAPVSDNPATDTPSAKAPTAAGEPAASLGVNPKSDLMDLDVRQENLPPVLQFTAPSVKEHPCHRVVENPASFHQTIQALEKTGRLEATELEILKKIQAQVHARENPPTPVKDDPRQGTYTRSELESLRSANTTPKVTTSIARKLADEQKTFLIGEHVYKTRYHTAVSLTEDFTKLTISDTKPVNLTVADFSRTQDFQSSSGKEPVKPVTSDLSSGRRSRINPFGPPPAESKGPSLPAHLSNLNSTTDHGAAARAQYTGGNDILAPVSDRQPLGTLSAPTRPTRRNKINETGFIALADNCGNVAAGKKGEDPLIVAHKRGL